MSAPRTIWEAFIEEGLDLKFAVTGNNGKPIGVLGLRQGDDVIFRSGMFDLSSARARAEVLTEIERRGIELDGDLFLRFAEGVLSDLASSQSKAVDIHSFGSIKGEEANESILPFRTALQISAETPQEVEWIAKPYVARGAITEIDGKVKRGKSTFLMAMSAKILDGAEFLGQLDAEDEHYLSYRATAKLVPEAPETCPPGGSGRPDGPVLS